MRRFLTYLDEEKHSSLNTLSAYQADLQQFVQVVFALSGWNLELEELSPEIIQKYAEWLSVQGYQPSTIARKMAATRSFLSYVRQIEEVGQAEWLRPLQAPEPLRRKPRVLSQEDLVRLLHAPLADSSPRNYRDSALLNLLYSSGLRASEIVELKVTDLLLEQGLLMRPNAQSQLMPLGSAQPHLDRYLRLGRPHLVRGMVPELFLNQRGRRLTRQGLWLVVRKWAEQVDIQGDVSPHTLRNTRTQHLLDQGMSRKEIQQLLGLSSPNAIRIYNE